MNTVLLKKLVPYFAGILLFIGLGFIFLNPVLQGKKLKQHDIAVYKAASKEIQDYRAKYNEEPLWTNSMFGGMPAYQISTLYPNNWIKKIGKILQLGLPHPVNILFLYFLGFFILLLTLKVDPWLSAVGAIAFAFSSYFIIIIEAGHNTKAFALAYMAPIIGGILLTFRGKYLLGAAITMLFAALEISANHLQITYYLLLLILILVAFLLVDHLKNKTMLRFYKASIILTFAAVLAVLPNSTNLMLTQEYSAQSMRGKSELIVNENNQTSGLDKDYATQWSYGIPETWSLLIPNIKGGASGALAANEKAMNEVDPQYRQVIAQNYISGYWGNQPFMSGPTYAGAIIMFLFLLGLFIVKGNLKWGLLLATLLSFALAWGKNLMPLTDFFMDYVPLYNKFRAVSMTLIIAEFTIPFLAILAIWELIKNPKLILEQKKFAAISFALTGGLSLLFYLFPGIFSFFSDLEMEQFFSGKNNPQLDAILSNIELARMSIFKADAIRSFFFISLFVIALFAFAFRKITKYPFIAIFGVLLILDLYPVNKRYLNEGNFERARIVEQPYQLSQADKLILQDPDPDYRVLNLNNPFNDASVSYFHKSIGGYHSAKLGRYQDLIDHLLIKEINQISQSLQNQPTEASIAQALAEVPALNMLNTKYIIYNPSAPPLTNPAAYGSVWFPERIIWVNNANEELEQINSLSGKEEIIIDNRFKELVTIPMLPADSSSIYLESYLPNHLVYKANIMEERVAAFSEIYYDKGWDAFIDGVKVDYFRVNYTLRGLIIPKGEHLIEFKFEPKTYALGERISLVGSIILLLALLFVAYKEFFQKPKEIN
ncbi:MAG: YfhO family protein [Bacteroidales bacterium]|nr:YfhO family protein [Bacteroidales bacterium]